MTEPRPPHLSDAEIDAYWAGALGADAQERIELHYLECDACQRRTRAVEDLRDQLHASTSNGAAASVFRAVGFWRMAAALFAALGALAGWQWSRTAADVQTSRALLERRETAAPTSAGGGPFELPLVVLSLAPPTRNAGTQVVTIPAAGLVVFELDGREAGPPGAHFDVTLSGPTGQILQVRGAGSSRDGAVRIPVEGALLASGPHVFELRTGTVSVGFPLLIQH